MAWWQGNKAQAAVEAKTGYDLALPGRDPWIMGMLAYWLWRTGAMDSPPASVPEVFLQMMTGNWQAAARAWERLHCPFERALALSEGDRDARLQALTIFDALGARPAAARLRDFLRRQGEKDIPRGPRMSTRVNPQGLTAREMEVLDLLAEGKSNAGIAACLSIAVKTVDHHVEAILAKLGVHSRSEAAAVLHKLNSSTPR
jgi:DNA-binding CsgD family transcriptional regulator